MLTRKQMAENFGINLERERTSLGLSQQDMSTELGMSLSSYKRLANGDTSKVDVYAVYRLSQLTGKMFYELCGEPSPLFQTFDKIRKLPKSQRNFVTSVINFEAEFTEHLPDSDLEDKDSDHYTTLLIPNGAMQDGMVYDSCALEKINIAPYRKRFGDRIGCALLVTSEYLAPVYHLNDILLIARDPVSDGDTGVFINKVTGLVYVRRFRQATPLRLEPLTYYGQTIYIDNTSEQEMTHRILFGHVLSKIRM